MSGRTAKASRRAAREAGTPPKVRGSKQREASGSARVRLGLIAGAVVVAALAGIWALTSLGSGGSAGSDASHGNGKYPYAIGSPGPHEAAPALRLPSTTGGTFDLAAYKGKAKVLLYFQEGLTCQPCFDQIAAIQKEMPKFKALGIGPIVSITTDPLNLLEQKAKDEGLKIPILSDSGASVSNTYDTMSYQMMGMGQRNGHSFILVGKDGKILWRADYGGAPKFTMFLPTDTLLDDLKKGIGA